METYKIGEVPAFGDLVRQRGAHQVMKVENGALGEEHGWEGVRNGVLCTWTEDGEECSEVLLSSQLVIVQRAISGSRPSTPQAR